MKRVIIHIGQPKAGSTALQDFFYQLSAHLSEAGIGYYKPRYRYNPWVGRSNADFLIYEALRRMDPGKVSPEVPAKLDEEYQRLRAYAERHDTILLSEEIIFHYVESFEERMNGGLSCKQEENWQYRFLSNIKSSLAECLGSDIQIDIFLYLRRQDLWALSKWKEDLRSPIPVYATFEEAFSRYAQLGFLDYQAYVKTLEQVFGKSHIILSRYERGQFDGGNIYYDFMNKLNLLWDPILDEYASQEHFVNPSLSLDAAYAMRLINSGAIKHKVTRGALYWISIRYTLRNPEKSGQYPMSRVQRQRWLDEYAAGNHALSYAYWNDEAALFNHDIADYEEYYPDEDKIFQIADKIILTIEIDMLNEYIQTIEKPEP